MTGVNKVILIGNLGKDPEVRHLENGATVANFSIATTESYKDKSGARVENTEWHLIVAWRGLADIAEKYLKKGSSVYLEGKLQTRSWEKDGITRYTTEVVIDKLTMLGDKNRSNDSNQSSNGYQGQQEPAQSNGNNNGSQNNYPISNPPVNSNEAVMDDLPF